LLVIVCTAYRLVEDSKSYGEDDANKNRNREKRQTHAAYHKNHAAVCVLRRVVVDASTATHQTAGHLKPTLAC